MEVRSSNNRLNYHYLDSKQPRRVVGTQLSPTGNGYTCVAYLLDYSDKRDAWGWINIKAFDEKELRDLVAQVINSMR
jgi:hypothetical protein